MRADIWKILVDLGRDIGLKIVYGEPDEFDIQYDGCGTALANNTILAAHEIGHFLVADDSSRGMVNYGLGADPDYALMDNESEVFKVRDGMTPYTLSQEENLSDVLGVLIQKAVGDDWLYTTIKHNWSVVGVNWPQENLDNVMVDELTELTKCGLIRDGVPVCVSYYYNKRKIA